MSEEPRQTQGVRKKYGTAILGAGIAVLAYGAVGFWIIKTLPPNGGPTGRLPSLYAMGGGILITIAGLVMRDYRGGSKSQEGVRGKIPTSYGILCS